MIPEFIKAFEIHKAEIETKFSKEHPDSYDSIVKTVIEHLNTGSEYNIPDPERIHTIDDGDYQGILLYIIGEKNYQPNTYWYVKVGYGSCSGCDTLQDIQGFSNGLPTPQQVADYMTLALHIVQGLKRMGEE